MSNAKEIIELLEAGDEQGATAALHQDLSDRADNLIEAGRQFIHASIEDELNGRSQA